MIQMGIDKYNEECRSIVTRYVTEWEKVITRTGRWIDFSNDYKTMDLTYMESVWWVFAQLFEKNLVYKGFKVWLLFSLWFEIDLSLTRFPICRLCRIVLVVRLHYLTLKRVRTTRFVIPFYSDVKLLFLLQYLISYIW